MLKNENLSNSSKKSKHKTKKYIKQQINCLT